MWNPLTIYFLVLLTVLGGGLTLCLWLDGRTPSKPTKTQEQWEQAQRARDMTRCADIEEGVLEWLTMLKLPELEEQTKLEAAARQLRIVLVEKLMRGPRVR